MNAMRRLSSAATMEPALRRACDVTESTTARTAQMNIVVVCMGRDLTTMLSLNDKIYKMDL